MAAKSTKKSTAAEKEATEKAIDAFGEVGEIWDKVATTKAAFTKKFNTGQYSGTSANPMYNIMRATALWGPMGDRWGFRLKEEKIIPGHPIFQNGEQIGNQDVISMVVELYYPNERGEERTVFAHGACLFSGQRANGKLFTDDDAFKKAFTDGQSKAFSYLGFAADIFLGFYDDVKYVNAMSAQEAPAAVAARKQEDPETQKKRDAVQKELTAADTVEGLGAAWKKHGAWIKGLAGHKDTEHHAIHLQEVAKKHKEMLQKPEAKDAKTTDGSAGDSSPDPADSGNGEDTSAQDEAERAAIREEAAK